MQKPEILETLRDAQLAHRAGDFVNALKFYEYFFDYALDHDPYALYGVRLSYCLDGWAKLAETFPAAHKRLKDKQVQSLENYFSDNDPEKFHDYYCISKLINETELALQAFYQLHKQQPKDSTKLAKYVWDDLVQAEKWHICSDLLPQPQQKLDEYFAIYDEAQQLKSADAEFDNAQFDQHLVETLLDGISNTVDVLRYNDRGDEILQLQRQFNQALEMRNDATLSKAAHAKASFLFTGH